MSAIIDLSNAITKHDINIANRILDEHPELLNENSESGVSFILQAYYHGARDIVRSLQSRGGVRTIADAVAADDNELLASYLGSKPSSASEYTADGWTALHLAAHFGNESAVTILVSHGANVNAWSHNDIANQPLHAGCAGAATGEIVGTLLRRGAEVNSFEHGGFTALHLAAGNGNAEIVKRLLAHGADRQAKTDEGKTASELASSAGHGEVVELLA